MRISLINNKIKIEAILILSVAMMLGLYVMWDM